ncbi:hypothetical protein GW830_01340 [bacterium]|nr:hypothetical protein [bacterium]
MDTKKSALVALTNISCTSEDVEGRDRFIQYIEAHKEALQIYTTINLLPKQELLDCFDSTYGTSFIDACNPEFIDTFCKKTKQEIIETEQKKIKEEQEKIEKGKENKELQQNLEKLRIDIKNNPYVSEKNKQIIRDNNPSSEKFKDAAKNILAELKAQAQKSGDFTEYRSFLDNFHSIGAISNEELLDFKKELDGFKVSSEGGKDGKQNTSEAIGKDLRNHEYEKVGDSYIRFGRLGEQTDEIVRIDEKSGEASKRIVSSKSGYAREIVFSKTPVLERDVKIGEINEKLSGVENKLTKITEYKKEQKILESTPNRTEKEESRLKELKSLNIDPESVIEAKLKEEKVRLESEKQELPQIEGGSQELQVKQEKDARDTIQFIDDMGLYMLGVENVDKFFDILNIGSSNGKINISNGLDKDEKMKIKQAFIGLLGQDIFEPNPSCRLRQGKMAQDIKNLLIEKKIYKEGEVPPVKFTDLQTAMTKNNA